MNVREQVGFLTAVGRQLEYRWIAPTAPDRPTLVFLHEGLGSIAQWKAFPDTVAAATGCGTFIYSRYGFGQSDPLTEPRDVDYHSHEALVALPAVLAARGIVDPIFIGHSDGATIALLYASDPRWTTRAVIIEAPHVFVEDTGLMGIVRARDAYREGDLRRKLGKYHRDVDTMFNGWAETWLRPAFRAWNIEARLPGVRCPVLLIQGLDDPYGTMAQVDAISRQVTGPVELMLIPECAHAPHVECEREVREAMVGFIAVHGVA
ncbi:alpha/beta fold hydrolase [Gemmatimonas sp.]|uniref:alpha/beta fold hydrolase n=1 Tax=Gemmatimonas sp. TaxID=1962908 RepID=UPI003982F32C